MNAKLFALSKKLIALLAIFILLPSAVALAGDGSGSRPGPAAPVEQMPAGDVAAGPSGPRTLTTRTTGSLFQAGGDRLAALQNNDGGWDWPLDDGNPASVSPKNTVGPIAQGLAMAYLHTGDPAHLAALQDAGTLLLNKTNNFSPSDGYLAATLDAAFEVNTYTQHVLTYYYTPLHNGTYDRNGAGTLYNTATYVSLIRTSRESQGIANLAAWDLGLGAVGAIVAGADPADVSLWIAGVEAEIDELDGTQYYDVIGLAGAVYALAYAGVDYDPIAGEHANASNLIGLAAILESYQIPSSGGFTWNKDHVVPGEEAVQETAYAILALNKLNAPAYQYHITRAADYLKSVQLGTGGWEGFPGEGENNELTGEALWAIQTAYPTPTVWVCSSLPCKTTVPAYRSFTSLAEAVDAVQMNGIVYVMEGTYSAGQIVIGKSLAIASDAANLHKPVLQPNADFTGNNAGQAWFLVESNVTLGLQDVVLDGTGFNVWQAIRSHGDITIRRVDFRNIRDTSNPYVGIAVAGLGGVVPGGYGSDSHGGGGGPAGFVWVEDCTFTNIGRIGVLVKGSQSQASILRNTYTGKGTGDWLDYAFEVGAGGWANIGGPGASYANTISNNTGVAASDGSTSAGILVTTYWGPGTEALIRSNTIRNNSTGVMVGYDAADASVVTITGNRFSGNTRAVESTQPYVDARENWWGTAAPVWTPDWPTTITGNIDYDPWYLDEALTILSNVPPATVYVDDNYSNTSAGGHYFGYDAFATVQEAIAAVADGGTINVAAGTYVETGQIVIAKNTTLVGADKSTTIIKPNQNTSGVSDDTGGWIVVNEGVTFSLSKVTLDGAGWNIRQAIRFNGSGVVDDVIIQNMIHPGYLGFAIAQGYSNTTPRTLTVTNSIFTNFGRVGIQTDEGSAASTATISGNTITCRGAGDNVSYGITVEGGSVATITNNTISNCLGVAASDGSQSAAIHPSTYFAPGTAATITGNTLYNNSFGIYVGYDSSDTATVSAHHNLIYNNLQGGIVTTSSTVDVDATENWWGNRDPVWASTVSDHVAYAPWCGDAACSFLIPVGVGSHDDLLANWVYTGSWTAYNGAGPANNTSHYANTAGSQAEILFSGAKFKLTYVKASNRGWIDVYVDGTYIARIDAHNSTLAWQQTWTSPMFAQGIHKLRLVHAGGGTYIDVDAIEIFDAPVPVTAGSYEDTDLNWTFSNGWTAYTGAGPSNNTWHTTGTAGSEAQITFNGSKFTFTYVRASNRGLIDVYVDGTKINTINAYAPTLTWLQSWTSPALGAGVHTVRFVHAGGGTYIDVDAIQIFAASDVTPPAAIGDLAATTGSGTGTVTLSWTAPGDDGSTGTATAYLVRYSTSAIDGTNWATATPVTTGIPGPALAGTPENMTVAGLVPGTTYFFAVRALDEDGNLGGISNSPSAPAQSPTAIPAGSYDDTDSNWIYVGSWANYNGGGPAGNTLHYSNTAGSEADISINGVKFKLTYVKASNRGLIDVYVDGVKIDTINAYAASTAWQATWTSPSFAAGVHTVRFVYAGAAGSYIDIDAIQVFDAPPPVTAGTYDDSHESWAFGPGWLTYSGNNPYNRTLHYSNTVGSEAQISFSGTRFTLTYVRASNRGSIDVYVDGVKIDTIDASNPTTVWQATWTSPVLTAGPHTVRFVHAGSGTYIDIDAITILP